MAKTIEVHIKRQEKAGAPVRWEKFNIDHRPGLNVISILMDIQRNPTTAEGGKTTPVSWDQACLEEVCGSCTMVINGKPRQACSTLVDKIEQPIKIEPMSKFPLIRDLRVNRQRMFEALKKAKAWIPIDGTYDLGEGPRMNEAKRSVAYDLSKCMTCGCCLEACPQYNPLTEFMGAAAISQIRLFNAHPTGEMNKGERLETAAGPGGVGDCGNAQNCVKVCPKEIPLTESIAEINKQVTRFTLSKMFGKGVE